jgi:hypothetical protein
LVPWLELGERCLELATCVLIAALSGHGDPAAIDLDGFGLAPERG